MYGLTSKTAFCMERGYLSPEYLLGRPIIRVLGSNPSMGGFPGGFGPFIASLLPFEVPGVHPPRGGPPPRGGHPPWLGGTAGAQRPRAQSRRSPAERWPRFFFLNSREFDGFASRFGVGPCQWQTKGWGRPVLASPLRKCLLTCF